MDTLSPFLEALLAKAADDARVCGRPYGRVVYSAGAEVAWDECCGSSEEGGQVWVRVVSLQAMPQGAQTCGVTHVLARVALGGVRCQYAVDEDGKAPTPDEMLSDARAQGTDAFRLLNSIRSLVDLPAEENPWARNIQWKTLRVETGLPLGPQGGCGGFEWTLALNLGICAGC